MQNAANSINISEYFFMCVSAAQVGTSEQVTDYALYNGMQVVVIEDHRAPFVVHIVCYKAGSGEEAHGVLGVAHFLEHLPSKKQYDGISGIIQNFCGKRG